MPGLEWSLDVQLPPGGPPSHLDAYKSFYALGDAGNDLALRLHPNGLCVVALAPSHAALPPGGGGSGAPPATSPEPTAPESAVDGSIPAQQTVAAAAAGAEQGRPAAAAGARAAGTEPQASHSAARLALSPKLLQAEFRRGRGPLLQPDTVLGRLSAGGSEWVLRCGVRGLLVDINARLGDLQGAALLRELGRSYLAVLDVRAAEAAQLAACCLSQQQYRERQAAGRQQQQQQPEPQQQLRRQQQQQAEQPQPAAAQPPA